MYRESALSVFLFSLTYPLCNFSFLLITVIEREMGEFEGIQCTNIRFYAMPQHTSKFLFKEKSLIPLQFHLPWNINICKFLIFTYRSCTVLNFQSTCHVRLCLELVKRRGKGETKFNMIKKKPILTNLFYLYFYKNLVSRTMLKYKVMDC